MLLTVVTHIFGLPAGQRTVPVTVAVPPGGVSVRDLICRKVEQEFSECVDRKRSGLSGEAFTSEELLGVGPLDVHGDAGREVERAQRAFEAREFMIVIDDQRVGDADEIWVVNPKTRVEFIKILPMVGG